MLEEFEAKLLGAENTCSEVEGSGGSLPCSGRAGVVVRRNRVRQNWRPPIGGRLERNGVFARSKGPLSSTPERMAARVGSGWVRFNVYARQSGGPLSWSGHVHESRG
ncbi:hypothetical protein KC19_1G069600 [Ceratodon purpureus]|uniref:Uncharacterized protein n=1 Tax=Ceratodon purpureus TaxID=3225 RepID=A0A8T0J4L7_CERPU|nr:hypothetical protein KC19_1G069600 [Ceratodon purpureus]